MCLGLGPLGLSCSRGSVSDSEPSPWEKPFSTSVLHLLDEGQLEPRPALPTFLEGKKGRSAPVWQPLAR